MNFAIQTNSLTKTFSFNKKRSPNFFLLPAQLLAGVTLPLTLAPKWLQIIAFFNSLSHAVAPSRALSHGLYTDVVVFQGFGVITAYFN
jgi:ABC-2 type transport system permease protein